jgi:hypothetical protein
MSYDIQDLVDSSDTMCYASWYREIDSVLSVAKLTSRPLVSKFVWGKEELTILRYMPHAECIRINTRHVASLSSKHY